MPDLRELLDQTSRTFALAIPLLPEPAETDVAIAYLLFRIADTFEDAERLSAADRRAALGQFPSLLDNPSTAAAEDFARRWTQHPLTSRPADSRLVGETPYVLEQLHRRDPAVQACIRRYASETAQGMISFLHERPTRVRSWSDLQRYCFYVAGLVGEMLAQLFALRIPDFAAVGEVVQRAHAFGEGLQLVNILKDADEDERCDRRFIPLQIHRNELFERAREDLRRAEVFIRDLEAARAPAGYIAFAQLPVRLAWATLDRVQQEGPGAKVPRAEVARILAGLPAGPDPRGTRT